jgi:hypothetical protein
VEKFEYVEINSKKMIAAEAHDSTSMFIRHAEFPTKEDIQKEYNEIYGEDYDEIHIESNY